MLGIFLSAQNFCHLLHDVKIVDEIAFPNQRLVVVAVFQTEPVAEVAPLIVLHQKLVLLADVVIAYKVDVAFHRLVVLCQECGVGILLVKFPRHGDSCRSPKESAKSTACWGYVGIPSRRTLKISYGDEIAAQELRNF